MKFDNGLRTLTIGHDGSTYFEFSPFQEECYYDKVTYRDLDDEQDVNDNSLNTMRRMLYAHASGFYRRHTKIFCTCLVINVVKCKIIIDGGSNINELSLTTLKKLGLTGSQLKNISSL